MSSWSRPSSAGAPGDTVEQPSSVAAAALTSAYAAGTTTEAISTLGCSKIVFSSLFATGGSPTLASVTFKPQWSMVAAPASDADWNDYLREQFADDSGVASEFTYEPLHAVVGGDLPKRIGIGVRGPRGLWNRLRQKGDGTVANVTVTTTYLRS